MHDVKDKMRIHDHSTGNFLKEILLDIGCVESFIGRREDQEFFFKFVSFLNPGIIYRYDFSKDFLTEYRRTEVKGLKNDKMETKQFFIESKDKTKIPVFIIAPKVG
jgi:prolyl oligopeptidase